MRQECHPLPGTNVPDPPPREAPSEIDNGRYSAWATRWCWARCSVSGGMRAGHRFGRTELAMTANGAIPVGPGLYRGAVGGAAHWELGDTELGLDISAPVGGTPIHARGVFEISRLF